MKQLKEKEGREITLINGRAIAKEGTPAGREDIAGSDEIRTMALPLGGSGKRSDVEASDWPVYLDFNLNGWTSLEH